MGALPERAVAMLAAVHARPGLTRAEASRVLGIGTGGAAEVVGRLVGERLLAEGPVVPAVGRGRPTRRLTAHPEGPLVLAAVVTHESWRVDAVELGGASVAGLSGRHSGEPAGAVLAELRRSVEDLRARFGDRVRGLGLAGPGIVLDERWLDATVLGWTDVDLWSVWPDAGVLVADNDATLAALAESRRGAAVDARLALHLRVDAGLGGAVVEAGRLLGGARGAAGEFGHLPMGDPAVRCACGARGCWGTAVDGGALARLLDAPEPRDPVTYARQVLARDDDAARAAVATVAAALGRGVAGLVNALDPDVVTLGGLGAELLAAAPGELDAACRAGLMRFRGGTPPPVVAARLGEDGPLTGAAERVWDRWWARLRR
ncbi:ROK family protein [Geodermatophilus nigrescens]|uniref:Sugar kinase of the NBD/HSP70 family, may contain an N-terminal HTH domain n=1 Tax=Geodermatophilus nigrescens TaxID=1070870 RepID=A0A1M5FXM6_9ACTN|nr:ROK family protein [Geodermatophilus nigrescens]SHF96213.1 Sugar kinase of the NBD/HSP70 family, may contain an N-terminal HTH domain [Geodermatophilus nigrescens]